MEQHLGKGALLEEALERLIPQLYQQAIKSQEIEPIDQAQIEISQTEPVVFKAIVPLKPTVNLGDYHGLKLESEAVEIGDEEIEVSIDKLRRQQALLAPVGRPVQLGDLVTIDVEASVEGKPFLDHKGIVYEVSDNSALPLPGFAESLEGAEKNKELSFNLDVPADYAIKEFSGKECSYKVTVTEIKEMELPQLNDEFAQTIGYDTIATLKEKTATSLRAEAEEKQRLELRQKVLNSIIEQSSVYYPPILEDREIDRLLEDEARRFGYKEVGDYLKKSNKIEGELREELRPIAKERIVYSLVLDKIIGEEKVEVSSSEVDSKAEAIINSTNGQEEMRKALALPKVRESIEQSLRTEKTIDRLVQMAIGAVDDKTNDEIKEG